MNIPQLISGGLITNYYCTSKCKHCLYNCSPRWEKKYIEEEQTRKNLSLVKAKGCYSVHIGGGEPMLNTEGLKKVLLIALNEGVNIDYVETNSSWFKSLDEATDLLLQLKGAGLSTLLVSISPFHNEHIPFKKTKGVIQACRNAGISVFPWVQGFISDLSSFDENKVHDLDEYVESFGKDYMLNIPNRYWIQMNGRALQTYKDILPSKNVGEIFKNSDPCHELTDTSHFHVDLFGGYVPGLCSGFSVQIEDLHKELDAEKYPLLVMLYSSGISALAEFAVNNYDFAPEENYVSKCHICFEIRKHLVVNCKANFQELQPVEYYHQM